MQSISGLKKILNQCSVKAKQIEKISSDLQYQGYIMTDMSSLSNEQLKMLWIDVRDIIPSNIYNVPTRYMNNTVATSKNMVLWGKSTRDICHACKENNQSLLHVVWIVKFTRNEAERYYSTRYTRRQDTILATLLMG